jgi:hydroxyacylglutathione hydrolase
MSTARRTRPRRRAPRDDFLVVPFVDEDLGNSAYLVGSRLSKEAVVIDPLRDVDPYLRVATRERLEITHALDTHLHNDFLSGSRELAARTDAEVGASAEARVAFDHRPLREGDRIRLDGMDLEVLATPGHTPEHVAFLARDAGGTARGLFSGGALIVGGAARTDLLGPDLAEPLARRLYRTVHETLFALPDDVAVYPTHGAGSFCAAPAASARTTTIGAERASSPLASAASEEAFVRTVLEGLPSYPSYFTRLRPINQRGPELLGDLPPPKALSPREVAAWLGGGGALVDVRPAPEHVRAHVPGSVAIPLEAPLVTWAGWLLPHGTPLVLVGPGPPAIREATRQLQRIGFDRVEGYLTGGVRAWKAAGLPVGTTRLVDPEGLRTRLRSTDAPLVLDVRQDDEWLEGHIPGAVHVENGRIPGIDLDRLKGRDVVVHCQSWNRSTAGLSVLARRGLTRVALLRGGFAAWEERGFEVERGSPPGA